MAAPEDLEAELASRTSAPRVTLEQVRLAIVGESYTMLPSSKVMVCELTLYNGFTVRGEAAVVDPANFREDIGREISREHAERKVWELLGFKLQDRLHRKDAVVESIARVKVWMIALVLAAGLMSALPASAQPDERPAVTASASVPAIPIAIDIAPVAGIELASPAKVTVFEILTGGSKAPAKPTPKNKGGGKKKYMAAGPGDEGDGGGGDETPTSARRLLT